MSVELQVVHGDSTVCGLVVGSRVGHNRLCINIDTCFVKFFEGMLQADSSFCNLVFLVCDDQTQTLLFIRISFREHITWP